MVGTRQEASSKCKASFNIFDFVMAEVQKLGLDDGVKKQRSCVFLCSLAPRCWLAGWLAGLACPPGLCCCDEAAVGSSESEPQLLLRTMLLLAAGV